VADSGTPRTTDKLADAHARFATAALWIYSGAAFIALSLLMGAVITDRSHNDEQTEEQLLLETEVLAHRLTDRLTLQIQELARLGLRSEVNLSDQSLEPERALLAMAHQDSPLFTRGVALLGGDGKALWAEPESFVPQGTELGRDALDAVAGVEPPRIVVTLGRTGSGLTAIRIEDNGPGVPGPLRERLFEPFVTGKPSGVGMGLSVSRKIAAPAGATSSSWMLPRAHRSWSRYPLRRHEGDDPGR
jgi:hypothetical protein